MTTEACKEYLVHRFPNTSKKDWKRLLRKKKPYTMWNIRIFENKKTGQLETIYSHGDGDFYHKRKDGLVLSDIKIF